MSEGHDAGPNRGFFLNGKLSLACVWGRAEATYWSSQSTIAWVDPLTLARATDLEQGCSGVGVFHNCRVWGCLRMSEYMPRGAVMNNAQKAAHIVEYDTHSRA
jgi:hypothetical protein